MAKLFCLLVDGHLLSAGSVVGTKLDDGYDYALRGKLITADTADAAKFGGEQKAVSIGKQIKERAKDQGFDAEVCLMELEPTFVRTI
ncbi:hypothetical protein [Mucilaginibacter defluvii]